MRASNVFRFTVGPGDFKVGVSTSAWDRFQIVGTTGNLAAKTGATTTAGWSVTGASLTTGDLLKLVTLDAALTAGKFINCYGGVGATSVFSVAKGGAVTAAGTVTAGAVAVAGASTLSGAVTIGNGYAGTGATLGATGAIQTKGAVTSDSSVTATSAVLGGITLLGPAVVQAKYARVTIAALNAGAVTLLPAVASLKYQLVDAQLIAIGDDLAAVEATGVAISGTQGAAPAMLIYAALEGLTRSTVCRVGSGGPAVLADGASFIANDVNTAITIAPVGGTDLADATAVDVLLAYIVTT